MSTQPGLHESLPPDTARADEPAFVPQWPCPPSSLELAEDEVHIWCAALALPEARVRELRATLTPDERARADRFHFEKDRASFTVARGVLRSILGRYLRTAPAGLRFSYGPFGKPALMDMGERGALSFNVSHSHGLALYCVTRARSIGIDVELVRSELADEKIAERFFAPAEVAELLALDPESRRLAFFSCWTRKEAYVKAVGQGLSLSLKQFEVSLSPDEPAVLLATHDSPREAARWSLLELIPGPAYVATLAVRGLGLRYQFWRDDENRPFLGRVSE